MKILFIAVMASLMLTSCSNNNATSRKTFCDTTCKSDSFNFKSADKFGSTISISVKNCEPDSLTLTSSYLNISRKIPMTELLNQNVRLNSAAINCIIKDTSYAWLSFNDCLTGRGFLFKLPFNKSVNISKISGAINSFDPKFAIDSGLRAYTDRGSIFVTDINTGKETMMSFKEAYDIDFNNIHEVIDSVNVTKKKIFVRLLKNGKEVPLEKAIDL